MHTLCSLLLKNRLLACMLVAVSSTVHNLKFCFSSLGLIHNKSFRSPINCIWKFSNVFHLLSRKKCNFSVWFSAFDFVGVASRNKKSPLQLSMKIDFEVNLVSLFPTTSISITQSYNGLIRETQRQAADTCSKLCFNLWTDFLPKSFFPGILRSTFSKQVSFQDFFRLELRCIKCACKWLCLNPLPY